LNLLSYKILFLKETIMPENTCCSEKECTLEEKKAKASAIIKKNMWWAAGSGLIIIPYVDMTAILLVNLKMIRELANLYQVKFSKKLGRSFLGSLISGVGTGVLSHNSVVPLVAGSLMKFAPVIGTAVGAFATSGFGAAFTGGVGEFFSRHFASGGTMENLDMQKATETVQSKMEEKK
jgi:uncharacterized protein (DUF697 family)